VLELKFPKVMCRILLTASVAAMAANFSIAASAQDKPTSPLKLPRPGYEYDGIQVGSVLIQADVDASIDYSSNVFRTSVNEQDDFRLQINPSLSVTKEIAA